MTWSTDGGPERLGRRLGRAVVRGRVAARQLGDPATREQVVRAGRTVAKRAQPKVEEAADRARQELAARGPDAAERFAQRTVDQLLWGLGRRFGLLNVAIRPLAQPVRSAAGTLARDLAKAAGGDKEPADAAAKDGSPGPLPEAADGGKARPGGGEPPDSGG